MRISEAIECLAHAQRTNRLAHGYIVEGPLRDAAVPMAEQFVLRLLCERGTGCGTCGPCSRVKHHTHADVQWVEPEKKSRKIGVERVRDEILSQMTRTSFLGSWKVCVIVGADRLGADSSNMLLKTLEEPPGRGLFLLLTDMPQQLLTTIRSRCQRIRLTEPESRVAPELERRLTGILAAGGAGPVVSGLGRAARLDVVLKELKAAVAEQETAAIQASGVMEEPDADEFEARVQARYLEERARVMREVLHWYRDLLLAVCGVDPALWLHRQDVAILRERAAGLTLRHVLRNLRSVEQIQAQWDRNLPEALVLGRMLSSMS